MAFNLDTNGGNVYVLVHFTFQYWVWVKSPRGNF